MGPLPNYRVADPNQRINAFENTAVDMAGPFYVQQGKTTVKRYLMIFCCMVYRAVHLEVAYTIDTESFLLSLSRFISRRGVPKIIRSDNGRNFLRGSKEVQRLWKYMDKTGVETTYPKIQWIFAAPYAPHTMGVVERLVGSVKRGLASVLCEQSTVSINDETFNTLAIKVEGIINSRPLTYVSNDVDDLRPITPNDFLLPMCARELPPISDEDGSPMKTKLKMIDEILTQLWNRFIEEYLPTLNRAERWTRKQGGLNKGDVVMCLEKGPKHRGRYPLGVIEELHPDAQGIVRHVSMRIGQSRKVERRHVRVIVKIFPDSFSLGGKSDSPKDKAISSDNQETETSTKEAQREEQEDGQQDPEVQYDEEADNEHNDKNSTPTLNRSVHLN
jgi:hypothetical protein